MVTWRSGKMPLPCINVGGLASAKPYLMIFTNTVFGNKTMYHHDAICKFVCLYSQVQQTKLIICPDARSIKMIPANLMANPAVVLVSL